jgi:hypothetical protein
MKSISIVVITLLMFACHIDSEWKIRKIRSDAERELGLIRGKIFEIESNQIPNGGKIKMLPGLHILSYERCMTHGPSNQWVTTREFITGDDATFTVSPVGDYNCDE